MRIEYLMLCPLLCISAKKDEKAYCLGRCGIIYDKKLPCQCNTACKEHRDCCADYDNSCPKEFCTGRCGQPYVQAHQCYCNTECKKHKNCCDDYDALCFLGVNESSTSNHIISVTTFITSDIQIESTRISTTPLSTDSAIIKTDIEESSSGLIAGVAVSLTVVMLIVVVILVLVFRKMHLRKQSLPKTVVNEKRTSKINYYTTENVPEDQYHDIDISDGDYCLAAAISDETGTADGTNDADSTYNRAISGVYDQLNGKDNRKISKKYENENASKLEGSKSEIYTLTSNQTVDIHTKDNNSSAKLKTPDSVDFDPTYNHSNNVIVREDLSNYDHFSNT
ncbi:uncharacterized protein LOC134690377 [Mytilus trossulus]|uniref:uncharacterized protein LOC134690377 n=1 Tax=Mytilus trossulus TaxID=6551 RepID=UPI003003AFA7